MSVSGSCSPLYFVDEIESGVCAAANAGIALQRDTSEIYQGRFVEIDAARLLNFGGCSYLGLEQRSELRQGAIDAIHRFGTQFSFSRVYLESPLYAELEGLLELVTGGSVLVASSTSLAHIAALPVLVGPKDAVLVDRSAHASVHTAAALLKDIFVASVPHNRMDLLEEQLVHLSGKHSRVWYLLDGLYSMQGDFAPLERLERLMHEYPALHLYVDDAHSTSWTGKHGRGYALDFFSNRERVVVALSLNKAFSTAGAALVFADPAQRDRVRRCGGPLLFSGPVQPPMLGAAIASARLHLQPAFHDLQQALLERIRRVVSLAASLGVAISNDELTPIFFVRCGPLERTAELIHGLRARGLYVSAGAFPAVPQNKSGVRFTVSLHNTFEDIEHLLTTLAEATQQVGAREQAVLAGLAGLSAEAANQNSSSQLPVAS